MEDHMSKFWNQQDYFSIQTQLINVDIFWINIYYPYTW